MASKYPPKTDIDCLSTKTFLFLTIFYRCRKHLHCHFTPAMVRWRSSQKRGFIMSGEELLKELQQIIKDLALENKKVAEENKKVAEEHKKVVSEQKKTEKAQQKTEAALQDLKAFAKEISADNKRRGDRLEKLFTGEWGKLVESLVKGGIIRLFNEKGIRINDIAREREKKVGDATYEFDIIAVDGDEMVVVEVKSTLDIGGLDNFVQKMKCFRDIFPEYRDKGRIHGAVAYLKENRGAAGRAVAEGLWVIRATGDSANIINPEKFVPRAF